MRGWRTDRLRAFPELHFAYEEEASSEDFFVPYVWTFVVTHTTIPWNPAAIALFSPLSATASSASIDMNSLEGNNLMGPRTSNGSEVYVGNGA